MNMRSKERYIVNGGLIGFGVGVLGDILIQWIEHVNQQKRFTWENYDGWRTVKNGLVTGAIGAGIGYLAYEFRLSEEIKHPFNADEHLKRMLSSQNLKNHPELFQSILERRSHMKEVLLANFKNKLASHPEDVGSFYKRTAIVSGSDLDIVLPFRKDSYSTLEEMYNNVFATLNKKFGAQATVIKRTKAIEITFGTDENAVSFDIVPGREISDYKTTKDLNLYVRPDWAWQKGSSFKTNISLQKGITVNMPEARRVIRLLKLYRDRNSFVLRSHIIEQVVVETFSNKQGVYYSDTENLLSCMKNLSQKLRQRAIIDYANTNNNIIGDMAQSDKLYIAKLLSNDVERIEENPKYIKEIFED